MILINTREGEFRCGVTTMVSQLKSNPLFADKVIDLQELNAGQVLDEDVCFLDGMRDKGYIFPTALRDYIVNHKFVFKRDVYCVVHNIDPACMKTYEDFFSMFETPVKIIPYRASFRKETFKNAVWIEDTHRATYFYYGEIPELKCNHYRPISIGHVARVSHWKDEQYLNKAKSFSNSLVLDLLHPIDNKDIQFFMRQSDKFLCGVCKGGLEDNSKDNTLEFTAIEAILNGAIPILGPEYYNEAKRLGLYYLTYESDWNVEVSDSFRIKNYEALVKELKVSQFDFNMVSINDKRST